MEKINKVKNWNQFLNEKNENTIVRLTFLNIDDFNKSIKILYNNDFKEPSSIDKGAGYYKRDDNWKTIEFDHNLQDVILHLLNGIEYKMEFKKPMDYKVFNQGGYLD